MEIQSGLRWTDSALPLRPPFLRVSPCSAVVPPPVAIGVVLGRGKVSKLGRANMRGMGEGEECMGEGKGKPKLISGILVGQVREKGELEIGTKKGRARKKLIGLSFFYSPSHLPKN